MAWMYQFWRHQHRVAQHRLRRQLLPSLTQRPRFARLCVGDAEVEVPADRLHAGDRIVVEEGEMVPADGWLAGGFAVVDERLVRGVAGLSRKEAGDPVFAGSFAIGRAGCIWRSPARAPPPARRSSAAQLAAAATPPPAEFALTAHGEAFARRAVGPTLAAAGFGLAVGDLTTAAAILRPDYATGPGLGVSMESRPRHRRLRARGRHDPRRLGLPPDRRRPTSSSSTITRRLEQAGLEVREVASARRRRRGRRPPARRLGVRRPGRRPIGGPARGVRIAPDRSSGATCGPATGGPEITLRDRDR